MEDSSKRFKRPMFRLPRWLADDMVDSEDQLYVAPADPQLAPVWYFHDH